jgi:hypothetical protein
LDGFFVFWLCSDALSLFRGDAAGVLCSLDVYVEVVLPIHDSEGDVGVVAVCGYLEQARWGSHEAQYLLAAGFGKRFVSY